MHLNLNTLPTIYYRALNCVSAIQTLSTLILRPHVPYLLGTNLMLRRKGELVGRGWLYKEETLKNLFHSAIQMMQKAITRKLPVYCYFSHPTCIS